MRKLLLWIKDAALTVGRGDILLKLGIHRYLPHIVVAFIFCVTSIVLSYMADNTFILREQRRKEVEAMRIRHSDKYREMVSLWRYTTVEDMLRDMGSDLVPPQNPATELE